MSVDASQSGENRPLNFGSMSVEQIRFLGRAIILCGDHDHEADNTDQYSVELEHAYVLEMGRLLVEDPDVGKAAIKQSALSDDDYDRKMAAVCGELLAKVDYPLARAVFLHVTNARGDASELAYLTGHGVSDAMPEVAGNLGSELEAVVKYGIDGIPARLLD